MTTTKEPEYVSPYYQTVKMLRLPYGPSSQILSCAARLTDGDYRLKRHADDKHSKQIVDCFPEWSAQTGIK